METVQKLARGLSPSWHIAKNGGGGSIGSIIRHTNPLFGQQQSEFDAQVARENAPRLAAEQQLAQQRQLVAADNERKGLEAEAADAVSPLRRRGRSLLQFNGGKLGA